MTTKAAHHDSNEGHRFLHRYKEIEKTEHRLPHWRQGKAWVFVTWRLADSLPREKLQRLWIERDAWLRAHPTPWDATTEREYHRLYTRRIDEWLDQGAGSCVLKDPLNAKIVADALLYFDGERYEMGSFVVMPNHVHALFQPMDGYTLPQILKSWKGFTSRNINQRIGRVGRLWQEEYWDRLIRNERHLYKVADYIRENPQRAHLNEGEYVFWERNENGARTERKRSADF